MGDKKKQKLQPNQQQYQAFQQKREIKRPIFKNCIKAFLIGGLICLIGQLISTFYIYQFNFTEKNRRESNRCHINFYHDAVNRFRCL